MIRYDISNGKLNGIENCLKDVVKEVQAMKLSVDPYLTKNEFGHGTTIGLNKEKVRGLLAQAQETFKFEEAIPRAFCNYSSIFKVDERVTMMPTMSYLKRQTDDDIFVGMGDQLFNINGVVEHIQYEHLPNDPSDVGSNSYYTPSAALSGADNVLALWKIKDMVRYSGLSGNVDPQIYQHKNDIIDISFLFRLKCTLTAVKQPAGMTLMPWTYIWKIRPNFVLEGITAGAAGNEISYKGSGWSQYFNGQTLPGQDAMIDTWYVPVGRVTVAHCKDYVKDIIDKRTKHEQIRRQS